MSTYSSHTVSLSLGDLKPLHEEENNANIGNKSLSHELLVLLEKAKGSQYEASLRRCLEHKTRTQQHVETAQSSFRNNTDSLLSSYRQELQLHQLTKSTQLATPLERNIYKVHTSQPLIITHCRSLNYDGTPLLTISVVSAQQNEHQMMHLTSQPSMPR